MFFTALVFLASVVQRSYAQDSFYFDPAPIGLDVIEGDDVRLRCDVSNRRGVVFYWTLNGKTIVNTTRRFQDDSDLRILGVSRALDAGSLRCVATNFSTGIALRSTEAKLNISWIDPTAEVHLVKPKPGEIAEGVELILQCQADGNPEPTVHWFQNRLRIFPNNRFQFSRNRLEIPSVTAADNGVYACEARNAAKTADSSGVFLVNVPGRNTPFLLTDSFSHSLLVKKNGRAVLNCQFKNSILTEWYFANNSLIVNASSDQKFLIVTNGSLIIDRVNEADAGMYRCHGIGRDRGATQAFAVELLLAYLDNLTELHFDPKPSFPLVIPVNGKFEIQCQLPAGLPLPFLRWVNPTGEEMADQGSVRATVDGLLVITNAQQEDTGNYSCLVENLADLKTYTLFIVVSVPPVITWSPMSTRVMEGETATFTCRVAATPFPVTVVTWIKDEVPLELSDSRLVTDPSNGTLKVREVALTDEGGYACLVNTSGHPVIQSTNGHLYVEKQLRFRVTPVHSKLELGSNSTIRCLADGRDLPQVKWLRADDSALPENVHDDSGFLTFAGVLRSHSGPYTCSASSEQGTISVTINVDVVVKPKLKVKPYNVTVMEGSPVLMHCVAVGDPEPTIQWDKNNRISTYDEQRFKVLSNGSLHISKAYMEDVGKYGCTAGNSGGFEREEAYLSVLSGSAGLALDDGSPEAFNLMKTVTIAVCSAVAYLSLVIGLIAYCSVRLIRQRNNHKRLPPPEIVNAGNGAVPNETTELVDKQRRDNISLARGDPELNSNSVVGSHNSRIFHQSYDHFAFPRSELETLGMLGKGYYGDVFLAKAFGIRDQESETLVVVKSLLFRSEVQHAEFNREMELLSTAVPHDHVVQLLGVCQETDPFYLISEYCEWGDLKQFLLTMLRENAKPTPRLPPLSTVQKLTMCYQVALAMEHLATNHLVHQDLAARNVLLSSSLNVKVANLGLCRDVYASEYFVYHQRPLPLRWMSPEAVLDNTFSTSSDVWSFGVFVWEVFTFACLPFAQKSDEDVLRDLRPWTNTLQPLTENSLMVIVSLVEKCMTESPRARLSFSEAVIILSDTISSYCV